MHFLPSATEVYRPERKRLYFRDTNNTNLINIKSAGNEAVSAREPVRKELSKHMPARSANERRYNTRLARHKNNPQKVMV